MHRYYDINIQICRFSMRFSLNEAYMTAGTDDHSSRCLHLDLSWFILSYQIEDPSA